jgi:TolB-like protein/Tfp pilus assembly protein PilF
MGLVSELRRRNVFRMAVLYAVAAWLIMQVAEVVIDLAHLPDWIGPATLGLLAVGFPIALIFSWFYELTSEGLTLEKDVDPGESITDITGRRMDFIVISLLSAAVLLFAWHTWWPLAPRDQSIAVLAFENMSGDPEQEYFSDGISEELLNTLAKIPDLRVISRSSSFSFKGKNLDTPTVAKQLNVAHVLEGSVRKIDNRVRITAQLIDARSDSHLWSETYDRELEDIFAVQNEIATAIGEALKIRLALKSGQPVQLTEIKAANSRAYGMYLRARELVHLRGPQNLEEAVRQLEHSLRLDDDNAAAHAQLAIAIGLLKRSPATGGTLSNEDMRRRAIPHLERAEQIDPNVADVYAGWALIRWSTGTGKDLETAIEHARTALTLNPSHGDARNWLYLMLNRSGRYDEAIETLDQLLVIDPLHGAARINYIARLRTQRRIGEADAAADQLLEQSKFGGYLARAYNSLFGEGEIAEGLSWSLKARAEEPSSNFGLDALLSAFSWVGEFDEARRVSNDLTWVIDTAERQFDEAISSTQSTLRRHPDNLRAVMAAANVLYAAGRFDEAAPLFERMLEFVPEGRPIPRSSGMTYTSNEMTIRLAFVRRRAGDKGGAQIAAQIARKDISALQAAGRRNHEHFRDKSMLAAFENDIEGVIAALRLALQHGSRDPTILDDAIYRLVHDEPRFVALRQELEGILAEEHQKVLQLVCFNNPVPDDWLPLPETCQGTVAQTDLSRS